MKIRFVAPNDARCLISAIAGKTIFPLDHNRPSRNLQGGGVDIQLDRESKMDVLVEIGLKLQV